jgi:transposase
MPTGIVGIESTGKADWFEELMFENGHKLLIGNAGLIRKRAETRHKSDSRDAENILALMMRQEVYNRLQALAHDFGLPKGTMGTKAFQEVLKSIPADPRKAMRRKILLQTVEQLSGSIAEIERKLEEEGAGDSRVALLRTQAGVGNLTALCLIHTLGEVGRFSSAKQVVSFTGLCPLEKSSGSRVRFGPISRTGSPLLRFMLGQAANTAIRRDERLRAFYRRLARKKTKPVAKTAAARKLLVKLSIMLRENITAQEFDLRGSTAGNTRAKQGLK